MVREINSKYGPFAQTLISRNFCQNIYSAVDTHSVQVLKNRNLLSHLLAKKFVKVTVLQKILLN